MTTERQARKLLSRLAFSNMHDLHLSGKIKGCLLVPAQTHHLECVCVGGGGGRVCVKFQIVHRTLITKLPFKAIKLTYKGIMLTSARRQFHF